MIFQSYALFPHMSVYDNIAIGPRIRKHSESQITKNIEELLEITHLRALRDVYPNQISGGEAQRVALARAVINRPKILFNRPDRDLRYQTDRQMQPHLEEPSFGVNFIREMTGLLAAYGP